ncbi:Endoplasmin-like protein [Abeliophyllum distichum]|uniref:Endoplasmin-like protein n=1 Tax=Abeliophyllum distichum TaxID=126358 RepID=A0ABD1SCL6_9LAMI
MLSYLWRTIRWTDKIIVRQQHLQAKVTKRSNEFALALALVLVLCLLFLLPDQGQKIQAHAKSDSDAPVDPSKMEEKIGAVPSGLSTDSDDTKREAESILRRSMRANADKFEFQAEVSRLMDIIINSRYSNKDIFLRELISNASDALDNIRFLSLTDKEVLREGDDVKLEIKTSGDLNLIGQFGVGFHSVCLVAVYVEVISKNNGNKQHVWESKADGVFAISEDVWNDPLGHGTKIRFHLRDEAQEYLDEYKLKVGRDIALLWHRLMGKGVVDVNSNGSPYLHSYAHCSKQRLNLKISDLRRPLLLGAAVAGSKAVTVDIVMLLQVQKLYKSKCNCYSGCCYAVAPTVDSAVNDPFVAAAVVPFGPFVVCSIP